jgi:hypothetical protein
MLPQFPYLALYTCCVLLASAFVLFPDLYSACDSVRHLKASGVASAVEVCDYASLRWGAGTQLAAYAFNDQYEPPM